MKIKVNTWIIFTEWGRDAVPYILDFDKEEVNDDEISLCIQEQIYDNKFWNKVRNKK